jgi:hypothetical protein
MGTRWEESVNVLLELSLNDQRSLHNGAAARRYGTEIEEI